MELTNDKVLITKDTGNGNNLDVDNVVNDGSTSVTANFASDNKSVNTIADTDKFNDSDVENNIKKERKRRRLNEEEAEQERIVQEEYDKVLREQRYKRLMHLLNKSQFYANFLKKKISETLPQEMKDESVEEKVLLAIDENKPPQKKGKKKDTQGYDIRQYILPKTEKKVNSSRFKINLSEVEITNELLSGDEQTPVDNCENYDVPKYFNGTLYEYQKEGLRWLKLLYENGISGILADEMGLGKTVQIIALLCHLIEKRQCGPYLIIVPLSTMPNWISEFKKFAPSLPLIIFYGTKEERFRLAKKIKQFHQIRGEYRTQPIVLTTFEIPLTESNFLSTQKWRYIIIDEGHRIKNYECKLVKVLKKLQSMNRLLLTGTPLQNDLAELWSLLNFLLPEIFDDLAVFESWFNPKELEHMEGTEKILKQEEEKHILSSLREILKPFILRREKSDVNLKIPPKKELIVYAPLTRLQHDLYKAILNRDIHTKIVQDLILQEPGGSKPKRRCVLKNATNNYLLPSSIPDKTNDRSDSDFWKTDQLGSYKDLSMWAQHVDVNEQNRNYLVSLKNRNRRILYKKIVNHPYLLYHPVTNGDITTINEDIVKTSGKLMVLDALLTRLKKEGHKVLLFSTMTTILDIIEDYLYLRDFSYLRLDGSIKIEERGTSIENFNMDSEVFLFLISTRAGGTGLNLAAADTVIIYDSDWNPQADIQAMARCHRIGQTRPVVIYRLCTKGTIDETIVQRAEAKRILEKMVISKELCKLNLYNHETLVELKQLLESKESKVITSSKEVFTEAELNELLDRSDLVQQETN